MLNIEAWNRTRRTERGRDRKLCRWSVVIGQSEQATAVAVSQNFLGYLCHFRLLCQTFIRTTGETCLSFCRL